MRSLLQFLTRYGNFLIFIVLEVVAFILIGTTHTYQHSVAWTSANYITASLQNVQTSVKDYFHLHDQNEQLAEENARLKTQLMLQANSHEYNTERDSQYIYSHLNWEYIPAKVIGLTTNKQHNYITINKGARDGITIDMGVVGKEGVVGIVSAVGEKYALVVPLIHTQMNISCRLKRNAQIGGTQWKGRDCYHVQFTDISRHISIEKGDTVVTSGLTPIFPQGILVGVVEETKLSDTDNYHHTTLRLFTDYKHLEYVQVLHNYNAQLSKDQMLWNGLNN